MSKTILLIALLACAVTANVCRSQGDPHNTLLNGKNYDLFNAQGDFLFYRYGNDLVVQERISYSQNWGRNSLLIGAAVRFGRNVFEIVNNNVKLNGKAPDASALKKAGVQIQGEVFTITYKQITIKIHNHNNYDRLAGSNYLTLYVQVPPALIESDISRMSGLCVEQNIPGYALRNRSLFSTNPRVVELPARPPRRFTKEQMGKAKTACRSVGLTKRSSVKNCAYDYVRARNKEQVLKGYKDDRKDSKALRKIDLDTCNKKEVDLKVAGDACDKARAQLQTAAADKDKYDRNYNRANTDFDKAVGVLVVAEREEHRAKAEFHADEAALNVARRDEDRLCNQLVRNVAQNTPCAELLNRARQNNRLQQCRDAGKTLAKVESKFQVSRAKYQTTEKRLREARVDRITKEKLRDQALEQRKKFSGIFNIKRDAKVAACTRFERKRKRFQSGK